MKKRTLHILLIAALVFACWLQFPVGMHPKKIVPGVMATCVNTGLTEGKKCMLCGKFLVAQQSIPATGLHTYDNDYDTSCNSCSGIREVDCSFEFENHRVVLRDENSNHKNLRVIIFNLGNQSVENPADEDAMQLIDSNAKTVWGIEEINRIVLTDAGNYVLLLKYNIGANVAIKVPMPLTIKDEPKLLVDGDNRITVVDKNTSNQNHTLSVYYLGEEEMEELADETVVAAASASVETYTDMVAMNEAAITQGGNYVFYLHYEAADGSKQTITRSEKLISRPALRVDAENKLIASCDDAQIRNFRAVVYYLGDQSVTDIYDEASLEELTGEPVTYWGMQKINGATLRDPGNYVIHLRYNIGTGPKKAIALKVTVEK